MDTIPAILAVDIGSSLTKISVMSFRLDVLYELHHPTPLDITVLWEFFCRIVKDVMEGVPKKVSLAGIGITGYFPAFAGVDAEGEITGRIFSYRDAVDTTNLKNLMETEALLVPHFLSSVMANYPQWGDPLPGRETIHTFVSITGYIIAKLTGVYAIDESQAADAYAVRSGCWEKKLIRAMGFPLHALPSIVSSSTIIGKVTREASSRIGVMEGVPVIAGCGDVVAQASAVPLKIPGDTVIQYGTTACVMQVTDKPAVSPEIGYCPYKEWGDLGLLVGASMSTGTTLQWVAENLNAGQAGGTALTQIYHELEQSAGLIPPGAEGHMVLPYLNGARHPYRNPLASGTIVGIRKTTTQAHIFKAAVEATGYVIRMILQSLQEQADSGGPVYASGGGAENDLLIQCVCDITGREQIVLDTGNNSLTGITKLILKGLGEDWDIGIPVAAKRFLPNPGYKEIYDTLYDKFLTLSSDLLPAMEFLHQFKNNTTGGK